MDNDLVNGHEVGTTEQLERGVGDEGDVSDGETPSRVPPSQRESIRLEVEVDCSEMDDDDVEIVRRLADQYERNFAEVVAKNRDYGWSFLHTGAKLAQSPATPFDHPARSQAYGLLTRAGDKRERLVENIYGDGDAEVSDPPGVTALEAANYYFFLAFVLQNPEIAASFTDG